MECPNCRLLNPATALRCDCGWDFASSTVKQSYLARPNHGSFALAPLSHRVAAQILDSIVTMTAALAPVILPAPIRYFVWPFGILFAVFYLLFADGFGDGQSYGKRIMKVVVVDARTGEPCTFGQSFGRNVLLIVLGMFDWVFILGRTRQRLGDMAARTLVIRTSAERP